MLASWDSTSAFGEMPYLGTRPVTLSGFTGAPDTLRKMIEAAQGDRGERSMVVRGLLDQIVGGLLPKDYAGEIVAVRNWVAEYVRYQNDPTHVELVKDPQTMCEEYLTNGYAVGDCDDMATLIGCFHLHLGRDAQACAVGFAEPGHFSHVFERCKEPRTNKWIICDPVAGTREREMAGRITTFQLWSFDELPSRGPVKVG
jgi:hypothetical protein